MNQVLNQEILLINIVVYFNALHVFIAPKSLHFVLRVTRHNAVLASLPPRAHQTCDLEPQSRLQHCDKAIS